ncbi:P-loop containing nucleoside triphosphate hydrolase protein [Apiospora kogelbergensis]|uniref:P-loop containing nucleoside triphosphate hydrolase protein n=1 Tax=Apiospora kogelbergensis TaxID=1337665 RepID=UPI00313221CD
MAAFNQTRPQQFYMSSLPKASILDFFFPGFTGISVTIEQLLAGRRSSHASLLCFFLAALYFGKRAAFTIWGWVEEHLTSTVQISNSSEVRDMVVPWLASQQFACTARSSLVKIRRGLETEEAKKKSLSYSPYRGTFPFFYQGYMLWLSSMEKDVGFHSQEVITISCLSRSPAIVKRLLEDCREAYLKANEGKTSIFEDNDGHWRRKEAKRIRKISTIIMDEETKASLMKDAENFVQSQRWYSSRGIPYRRGYLLYGRPGGGKSSLSLALAGRFGLEIYILNLSNVSASNLRSLIADLPPRCVLLLEDVDAVNMTLSRQADSDTQKWEDGNSTNSPRAKAKAGLSLSDLLNALDGVSAQEGRILVMTSNHPEHLDEALIRPGRVDLKIELPLADSTVAKELFCMVFKQTENDICDPERPVLDGETVEGLAKQATPASEQWDEGQSLSGSLTPSSSMASTPSVARNGLAPAPFKACNMADAYETSHDYPTKTLWEDHAPMAQISSSPGEVSPGVLQGRVIALDRLESLIHEVLSGLSLELEPKSLYSYFDGPSKDPSTFSWVEMQLMTAIRKLAEDGHPVQMQGSLSANPQNWIFPICVKCKKGQSQHELATSASSTGSFTPSTHHPDELAANDSNAIYAALRCYSISARRSDQNLLTVNQVTSLVQNILEQNSGVLAQRPVFDCLGDPDLDTSSWFVKRLTKSLEELATAKGVPNTPPPSESGEECTPAGDEAAKKEGLLS